MSVPPPPRYQNSTNRSSEQAHQTDISIVCFGVQNPRVALLAVVVLVFFISMPFWLEYLNGYIVMSFALIGFPTVMIVMLWLGRCEDSSNTGT